MPFLVFNSCCGGINLRSASITIGYVQLVCQTILAIMFVLLLAMGSVLASGNVKSQKATDSEVKTLGAVAIVISVICLLVTILAIGSIILLLIGVNKKRRGHVKAYLIIMGIFVLMDLLKFLSNPISSVTWNVINVIMCVLNVYFWLVVRSYYYKMDSR